MERVKEYCFRRVFVVRGVLGLYSLLRGAVVSVNVILVC